MALNQPLWKKRGVLSRGDLRTRRGSEAFPLRRISWSLFGCSSLIFACLGDLFLPASAPIDLAFIDARHNAL